MARPCKQRRICAMPDCERFGPKDDAAIKRQTVIMSLDEFESVRLIDLEGMTQEQCAAQMKVARTTAQAIYNIARIKMAECLVNEKDLHIEGGDYVLCDGDTELCSHGHPCRKHCRKNNNPENNLQQKIQSKRRITMKIAVTYENGEIFQHFGHTENFKVYEVENEKVISSAVVSTNGSGHGALTDILKQNKIDILICGGIGGGARRGLDEAGIKLYGGTSGDADKAVEAFLTGTIQFDPNVTCDHHGEHHDGVCGDHGCGENRCEE
ncbi:MAG: NifB/NifX family molybdenum-iron cluster-binding protein [Acetivibrio sp.]